MSLRFALIAFVALAGCSKPAAPPPAAVSAPQAPFKIADVFPEGPGQEKVLNTCGSCHSLLCATRGQRTKDRWEAVKTSHKDKMQGASADDLNAMFGYLAANFNDTKPEPVVPGELLQQGCTPF
jgi:cytochrome c5